ncbi:MAG TPA: class II aldolase/adducin family protein [Terriglobia bacterium]|nr:class II aldolase/adducin family protein [Terriglobia bacterium]
MPQLRAFIVCNAMLLALGVLFLTGCASQAPPAEAQTPAHPEQALIEDLVLANRMLASRELAVLDAFGHVSMRSRTNPGHYFISRYVAPGMVSTSDIIENDLDSKPVSGPRPDEYREVYIHGEIYKARPDVMAIVHSHSPELVAFSVSSVPLRNGDNAVPIFDIRKVKGDGSGLINSPAIGQAMAESLGRNNSILLLGHGAVVTSNSVYSLVSNANGLRNTARLQQMLISMGGAWDSNPRRVTAPPNATQTRPAQETPEAIAPSGTGGGRGGERGWEYWKQLVLKLTGGKVPVSSPPAPAGAASPDEAIKQDLAHANRMLAAPELGILDAFGHVSVRNPRNPNHYFISRYISAGVVTPGDIIENDLDSQPATGPRSDEYQEVYMHGEIYKARPDVMAVLHAHTPEIVAFTQSSVTLRPVVNGGAFIGDGLPMFDIRKFDPRETIITSPALGRGVAQALGSKPAVLLKGHGIALTDSTLNGLISRAYNLRMNARIQQQAIALGGKIAYLEQQPALPPAAAGFDRAWEYWKRIIPAN